MNPIISVENLSKQYRIGTKLPYKTFRETLMNAITSPARLFSRNSSPLTSHPSPFTDSSQSSNTFWALKDVSFEVQKGEVLGIIGRNGAGKTTLLKILSRVTEPTEGEVKIRGRVGSLLEVGTGFHPELTGRENIFLNGAILGMRKEEIKKKFDEIVAFSEVEKFLDTPMKRYSSGMYVRLAFAVAAHLEPEILLVDEVLAVGDAAFQKKCLGKMGDVAKEGRTVLFVSHSMGAMKQLCSRCLFIEEGKVIEDGETLSVIDLYLKRIVNDNSQKAEKYFEEILDKEFQVLSVRMLNEVGEITQKYFCDEPIFIELICVARKALPGLYGYMTLNKDGICVLTSDTYDIPPNCLDSLPPNRYKVTIRIPPRTIGHGNYSVYLNFTSFQSSKGFNVDSPKYVCSFQLDDHTTQRGNRRGGYLSTLLKWEISPL